MTVLTLLNQSEEAEAAVTFPTTDVLDNFNRANAGSLGANWTQYITAFTGTRDGQIVSNQATGDLGTTSQVWWNPSTFDADQEAYFTIATLPSDTELVDIWLRLASIGSGTTDGYTFRVTFASGADTFDIRRLDNATGTSLDTATVTVSAGDSIGATAIGDELTFWHKPAAGEWTEILSATDATYSAGGHIGISLANQTVRIDDFGGGTHTEPAEAGGQSYLYLAATGAG